MAVLGRAGLGGLGPAESRAGVAFALGAAVMWAAYIVLSARVGHRFPKAGGLALAVTASAVIMLPFGVAEAGTVLLEPSMLLMGTVVAVLASVLPYSLEMLALRRMPTTTFAVLMSLGPAVAALAGFLLHGQALTLLECLAITLVITAAMGAVGGRKGSGGRKGRGGSGGKGGTNPAVSSASPARTPSRTEARRTLAPATPDA
ncbi:EamA family transporter [Actinoplanes sp. CA-015351]|uniref:EamA family transporter n=1 Tax=Actinoplanes sp. CA-015351 TaxID=3239897 RepID=UPI003D99F708